MAARQFEGSPIFVGGDGRSGTTLLCLVLDSHPDLVVGPELHFSGPENLGSYLLECCQLLADGDQRAFGKGLKENPRLKRGVQFAKRCHRFGIEFTELSHLVKRQITVAGSDLSHFEDRCGLIHAIGEQRRQATAKQRWGIKIMRDIARLPQYSRIWPRAQFIHIVRDGRDVAASQMRDHPGWGYNDVVESAQGWLSLLDKVQKNGRGQELLEIRYEDLATDPEPVLRRLVDFLDVPWDDRLLRHHEAEHTLLSNPYNHASLDTVVKPINTTSVGRYKRDLSPEQVAAFNKLAGKQLAAWDYDLC